MAAPRPPEALHPEALPPLRRLGYALGNAGFQIPDRIVVTIAVYFYLPPAESDLAPRISQEIWFGAITAYGLARLIGGVFDSAADPFVGFWSDRSRSRLGRRRSFLMLGIAPMVSLPVLLFWPPGAPGSTATFVCFTVLLSLYYVAFTLYVGPYLALIPELAPTQQERVRLATALALASAPVVGAYPVLWPAGVELCRSLGLAGPDAFRAVVVVSAALAFLLCLGPILAVDERRFARSVPATLPLGEALGRTLRNRPFLIYLGANILFIAGVTMMQPALPYYAVVALGRSEGFASWLGLGFLPGVVAGFLLLPRVTRRIGPKRTVMGCVAVLGLCLAGLGALRPALPGGEHDAWNLRIVFGALALAGIPIAGFLVLPHVLISQLVDLDERRTGANRSAMFFGVQGLLTKWVYAASLALLSLLLARYGNSRESPEGVLLVGPVAAGFCLLSAFCYALYPERRILEQLSATQR